jgi:hypothetical protein
MRVHSKINHFLEIIVPIIEVMRTMIEMIPENCGMYSDVKITENSPLGIVCLNTLNPSPLDLCTFRPMIYPLMNLPTIAIDVKATIKGGSMFVKDTLAPKKMKKIAKKTSLKGRTILSSLNLESGIPKAIAVKASEIPSFFDANNAKDGKENVALRSGNDFRRQM